MRVWEGKKVVILGAARQGVALARYLAGHGARVLLNDQRPCEALASARQALSGLPRIEWVCGGHPFEVLDGATLVCPSGGVPLDLPIVVEARRRGIPLSNDSQLFLEAAPCRVVGITGSAGKTTTTTLVGRMAQSFAPGADVPGRVWVGGNIGSPLIAVLDRMAPEDLAVMELSSFQLEIMDRSPQVAAVLNVTPNHLDRHGTMEAYSAAKARILDFQGTGDVAVLGRDDPGAWGLAPRVRGRLLSFGLHEPPGEQEGSFVDAGDLCLKARTPAGRFETRRLMAQADIPLRGEHNQRNVLAACAVGAAAGLPDEALRAGVLGFEGVPHRLQWVRRWGGADWYNDSIATAPERALAAIQSFDEPLILLAGGRDKDLPWGAFAAVVRRRVKHLVLFGEAAGLIEAAVRGAAAGRLPEITRCAGLQAAVQAAAAQVEPGDVVLLAPGGTSFDEFVDFEERGLCFAQWVNELP